MKGIEIYNWTIGHSQNSDGYLSPNGNFWQKKSKNTDNRFTVIPNGGSIFTGKTLYDKDELELDGTSVKINNKKEEKDFSDIALEVINLITAEKEANQKALEAEQQAIKQRQQTHITFEELLDKAKENADLETDFNPGEKIYNYRKVIGNYEYFVKEWEVDNRLDRWLTIYTIKTIKGEKNKSETGFFSNRYIDGQLDLGWANMQYIEKDPTFGVWCTYDIDHRTGTVGGPERMTKAITKAIDKLFGFKSTCDIKKQDKTKVDNKLLEIFIEDIKNYYEKAYNSGEKYNDFLSLPKNEKLDYIDNSWWIPESICRLSKIEFHKLAESLGFIERHKSNGGNTYWWPTNAQNINGVKRNKYMVNITRKEDYYITVEEFYDVKKIYEAILSKNGEYNNDELYMYFNE